MARNGLKFNPEALGVEDFDFLAGKVKDTINKKVNGAANTLEGYVGLILTGKAIIRLAETFKADAGLIYLRYGTDGMKMFGSTLANNYGTKYDYSKKIQKLEAELAALKEVERATGKAKLRPVEFPFRINE